MTSRCRQHTAFGCRRVRTTLLLVALLAASSAGAQRIDALRVGVGLRIERLNGIPPTVRGDFVSRDESGLTFSDADDANQYTRILYSDIRRLEYTSGQRTAGQAFQRGATRGAIVGLGLAAGLLVIGAVADRRCTDYCLPGLGLAAVGGALVTAVTTLTAGMIGLGFRERWEHIPLPRQPSSPAR